VDGLTEFDRQRLTFLWHRVTPSAETQFPPKREYAAIPAGDGDKALDEVRQRIRGGYGRIVFGQYNGIHLAPGFLEDCLKSFLFVREIAVERAEPEVGLLGDVRDRCRFKSIRGEKIARGLYESVAVAGALSFKSGG
jgi:hypothetical protein